MASRRDWLLQQMGITQYRLRRPRALHGEIAISVSADTRLLIVAETPPAPGDALIHDVLATLQISENQTMALTPDQLQMLPETLDCAGWLLGVESEQPFNGVRLCSPVLNELTGSADARRALWRQICEHDGHFFTHAR